MFPHKLASKRDTRTTSDLAMQTAKPGKNSRLAVVKSKPAVAATNELGANNNPKKRVRCEPVSVTSLRKRVKVTRDRLNDIRAEKIMLEDELTLADPARIEAAIVLANIDAYRESLARKHAAISKEYRALWHDNASDISLVDSWDKIQK